MYTDYVYEVCMFVCLCVCMSEAAWHKGFGSISYVAIEQSRLRQRYLDQNGSSFSVQSLWSETGYP